MENNFLIVVVNDGANREIYTRISTNVADDKMTGFGVL